MKENIKDFFKVLFYGLATIATGLICWIATDALGQLKGINTEMKTLNEKMVEVVTDQKWQNKSIERHDVDINDLKKRVQGLEVSR